MSNVTDVFVIIGDTEDGRAEDIAPRVAEALKYVVYIRPVEQYGDGEQPEAPDEIPVISLAREDFDIRLIQGGRYASSACIWFGWNHGHPEELEEHLKAEGFTNITVWSHREDQGTDGIPPRVVSW